ncbi:MAG: hypothetical protein KatS3mg060_0645 [Dehalococcoidia bacterium]|nr:MAG: hypothetical protein KatS3mg060_0645 [Dehalococcoidia bacterium]
MLSRCLASLVALLSVVVLSSTAVRPVSAAPAIFLSQIPPLGSSILLQGRVLNVDPATVRVAVALRVSGTFWSKPSAAAPLTTPNPDGTFSTTVVTGGNDQNADLILVWIFPASFNPPALVDAPNVPPSYDLTAIAEIGVTRTPGQRWIQFAGQDWWVKTSSTPVDPGPNYFTDRTDAVFVDAQGRLNLRVEQRDGRWEAVEIVSLNTFGYGTYMLDVASTIELAAPQAVFGLFTWDAAALYPFREIDLEFSRGFNPALNAQFVVQPAIPENIHRYLFNRTPEFPSRHQFTWRPEVVEFRSFDSTGAPVESWNYTTTRMIPHAGTANVRINLWLLGGTATTDGRPIEMVVSNFTFTPLDIPAERPTVLIPWVSND